MKRFIALILLLVMIFSLAACGKDKPDPTVTDDPNASPEVSSKPQQSPEVTKAPDPKETQDPKQSPAPTDDPSAEIDPEDYEIGITEEGENIVVTVLADTPQGEAVCKMTYVYNSGALQYVSATYILPNGDLSTELADSLRSDETIDKDSIVVNGATVECRMVDSEIADFKTIGRDELLSLLNIALSLS